VAKEVLPASLAFDLGKKARDFHCMIVQRALCTVYRDTWIY